jgi:hypothetical protein
VRLPRDWLGPREELVPIGPAARARARARAAPAPAGRNDLADQALPPTAFWSQDSAALHDAVQAPSAGPVEPWATPAPLTRSRTRLRWRRLEWTGLGRARWALLAVPAVALVVLAVIGNNEQRAAASRSASRQNLAPAPALPAMTAALSPATRRHSGSHQANTHSSHRTAARARPHARDARVKTNHPQAVSRRSHERASTTPSVSAAATADAPPTSGAASTTPVTESSPPGVASSGSTAVSSSTSRSVSTKSAKPAGPTGPVSLIGAGTSPSG